MEARHRVGANSTDLEPGFCLKLEYCQSNTFELKKNTFHLTRRANLQFTSPKQPGKSCLSSTRLPFYYQVHLCAFF